MTLSKAVAKVFTPGYDLVGAQFEAPASALEAPIICPVFDCAVRYLPLAAGGAGDDDEVSAATGMRIMRFNGAFEDGGGGYVNLESTEVIVPSLCPHPSPLRRPHRPLVDPRPPHRLARVALARRSGEQHPSPSIVECQ